MHEWEAHGVALTLAVAYDNGDEGGAGLLLQALGIEPESEAALVVRRLASLGLMQTELEMRILNGVDSSTARCMLRRLLALWLHSEGDPQGFLAHWPDLGGTGRA